MELIIFALIFLGFIIGSYEDARKKEIYDYLNFSLAFFVLIVAIVDSLINNSIDPVKYAGFGLLLGFTLGSLLYFLGVWGGGDAKFLIGFSAAAYYIYPYANTTIPLNITNYLLDIGTTTIYFLIENLSYYLIIINIIAALYILFFLTQKNYPSILKNAFSILILLFVFTIGLLSINTPIYILGIGIIAFILIFFGDDYLFYSVFFKIKKKLHNLDEKDIPDSDISQELKLEDTKYGLSKEQLLRANNLKNRNIKIRKILPYSFLITLNFLVYILSVLKIDEKNFEILFFLVKVLFASFLAGGIIAILMMAYYGIKNHKKLNILNVYEKVFGIFLLLILIAGFFINYIVVYFAFLGLIYYLVKFAKKIEGLMFVKNRSVEKLVPGDWILQDIKVGEDIYFTKEDFKLGVTEEQLEKIRNLAKHHPKLNYLTIKDGIAFLPPLFVGFIIAMLL